MSKSALHMKPHNIGKRLSFSESSEQRVIENNGLIKNSKVLTKVRNAGNIPPVINEERESVIRSHENKARIENALRLGKLVNKPHELTILPESSPKIITWGYFFKIASKFSLNISLPSNNFSEL